MSITKDDVAAAMRVSDVLAHAGIVVRPHGRWHRGKRCPSAEHANDAFGVDPETGKWACHACATGGDLFTLLAVAEGLDVRSQFADVLRIAAQIADVVPGQPPPVRRPPAPTGPSISERIATAKTRAAWLWSRCSANVGGPVGAYLESRGLSSQALLAAGVALRSSPIAMSEVEAARSETSRSVAFLYSFPGVCVPVHAVADGTMLDVRRRVIDANWARAIDSSYPARWQPAAGSPKIVGMPGNVTTNGGEMIGCYGRPDLIDGARDIVVCEGLFDYLSCVLAWPGFAVLGAVNAAQMPQVASFATARAVEGDVRVILVAQNDPPRTGTDGVTIDGAATKAIDEARCLALRRLPHGRVPLALCRPEKDANAIVMLSGFAALRERLTDAEEA